MRRYLPVLVVALLLWGVLVVSAPRVRAAESCGASTDFVYWAWQNHRTQVVRAVFVVEQSRVYRTLSLSQVYMAVADALIEWRDRGCRGQLLHRVAREFGREQSWAEDVAANIAMQIVREAR